MIGELTLGTFKYGFRDAKVQTGPGVPPVNAKVLVFDTGAVELVVPFVGAEQWAEFQRQVAAQAPPSSFEIVSGHMLNGGREH